MTIEMNWLVEGRIVDETITGQITSDDIREQDERTLAYLAQTDDHLMHMIVDFSAVSDIPGLGSFSGVDWLRHKNLGWVVVYGMDNKLVEFVSSMVLKVTRVRYRFVESRADALAFLQEVDVTLPDLSALTDAERDDEVTPQA